MEAKKITWVEVVGRVLLFIPVVTIITYSAIKHWAIMVYNFVVYGGETAIYNDKKLTKLNDFNASEKANEIEPIQKSLLIVQAGAMYTYLECLKERLVRL